MYEDEANKRTRNKDKIFEKQRNKETQKIWATNEQHEGALLLI